MHMFSGLPIITGPITNRAKPVYVSSSSGRWMRSVVVPAGNRKDKASGFPELFGKMFTGYPLLVVDNQPTEYNKGVLATIPYWYEIPRTDRHAGG